MLAQANFRPLFLATMLASNGLAAQTIDAYRYWIDGDATNAITNAANGNVFTLSTPIPTSTLAPGFHSIDLQFRDSNGAWSAPVERYFSKSGEGITAYRYWYDDEVADAVTTNVANSASFNLSSGIATDALTVGPHKVSMTFRNGDGVWSAIVERYFSKTGAALTAWQYWFDDDVNNLVETAAGPNTAINIATDIDASALSFGTHNITWRMKDALGNWSVPVSQDFSVVTGIAEIPGLERVVLFPNPAGDLAHIRFEGTAAGFQYDVVDADGRSVLAAERAIVAGSTVAELDLVGVRAGMYHLRLIGTKGTRDIVFVKQ